MGHGCLSRYGSSFVSCLSWGSVVSRSPGVVDPSCHVHRLSPHFLTHPIGRKEEG